MDSKIKFWNPFTKSLDEEKVYGERWLKFTYNNPFGRIGLWGMVKRGWFSSWYGSKMNAPKSASKIAPFIEKYRLDKEEFLEPPHSFNSFNQFFFRKLKPNARPISKDSNSIVFPQTVAIWSCPIFLESKIFMPKVKSFVFPRS